jgi:hypothetical protein
MDNQKITTYSFRLPEQLKARMEHTAESRNLSFNQLLLEIIHRYYVRGGYIDSPTITSVLGREYDINIEESRPHPPDQPTCFFYLRDPISNKLQSYYTIGLTRSVIERLGISERSQYAVIYDVGLAMLHYYNRIGHEITALRWNQFPSYPNRRVLTTNDLVIGSLHINSLEMLLQTLKGNEDNWQDQHLLESLSVNNGLWSFSGEPIGYIVEKNFFAPDGTHAGVIKEENNDKQLFSIKGRYIGHIIGDRLLSKPGRKKSESEVHRLPAKYPLVTPPRAPLKNLPHGFSDA